jgi:hypothetical protein
MHLLRDCHVAPGALAHAAPRNDMSLIKPSISSTLSAQSKINQWSVLNILSDIDHFLKIKIL